MFVCEQERLNRWIFCLKTDNRKQEAALFICISFIHHSATDLSSRVTPEAAEAAAASFAARSLV